MKLKRLAINRLPGIARPFEINAEAAGFHVVFGPNGIGKSSICRAVESLYWNDRGPSQGISTVGEFELDEEFWWAEREGSRVRWQRRGEDSMPPTLPGSHNHRCFFLRLRDLIDPSSDGTQDIASEIRRQMSGGFDLDQIAAELFIEVKPQHGRPARNDFDKASRAVQEAEGQQSGLQRRADRLDVITERRDAADAAERRLTSVERAIGLASRLQQHAGVAERIAVMPEGLANLSGNERDEISRLQSRIDELNKRAQALEAQRGAARDAKRESRLAIPLPSAEITILREQANELGKLELALETAQTEHAGCRRGFAAVLSAVGGGDIENVKFDVADHGQVFEFLRAVETHRTRTNAIQERVRLIDHVNEETGDRQGDLAELQAAVDALRSWLRAPDTATTSNQRPARKVWIGIALALAVVGIGLAVFYDPVLVAVAGIGLGIALPLLTARSSGPPNTRESAQATFEKLSVDKPDAWDIRPVESRLRNLESEAAEVEAQIQRVRDRNVDRQTQVTALNGLSEEKTALDAKREALANGLNLHTIPADAELVDFARALDQLRLARIETENAAGKVDDLETKMHSLLSDLAGVLESHDEPQPGDARAAAAYVNSLADRNSRLEKAISDEKQATTQLEQVSADRDGSHRSIERIYSEIGLNDGDLSGLEALLESLPHYRELTAEAARLTAEINLDRTELEKSGEADLAECDEATLKTLLDDLQLTANEATDLRDEIAEINAEVNEAKRGRGLQELIAARDDARTKLLNRRDDALYAMAGRFLIDSVESEYVQTQMPRVFERARHHFSVFTHHNYELHLSKESTPRLFAIELSSGEGRTVDALSDGTRAQLLLAARIAFAEEVEQGRTLPLFLDEALDQSDPSRFEAIVRSLGRVAKDQDRQIFYLTSDPVDVDRIRHALAEENCEIAAAIDLGLIRRNAASVSGPQALYVAPAPMVPEPGEMSAEDYGVVLGVPQFAPMLGYEQQHFFFVLSDHLNLLRNFLMNGIEHVGQWRTVSGTALAETLGSGPVSSAEIAFRIDLLQHFCELWAQGRGRPVYRDELEQSGALSPSFLDNVVAIADELNGDPEKLVAVLAERSDPRLKRIRRNSLENLEQYLRDNGYLDDQSVLDESELGIRALSSHAANELPDGVARECLNRWWTWAAKSADAEGG